VTATLLLSVTFLVALIVFQSAAALGQRPEPVTLKPPFKFQVDARASAAGGFPGVPITATRLLTETFGDAYQQTASITGTTPAWRYYVDPGDTTSVYWNRVISQVTDIYTDTAWASCGICNGGIIGSLNPDTDPYPDGQGAWLVYGPLALTGYYAAEATFNYWMDVRAGDGFWFGVSDDGTTFTGSQIPFDGAFSSGGWLTHTFNLGGYAGAAKPDVYLGFYFRSNTDMSAGKGVFVDNVILRAVPYRSTFLPVTARNFAIATATPTYLYNYTYGDGTNSSDPHLLAWGGTHTYPGGSVGQGLVTGGNPGGAMFLYEKNQGEVAMAGPNLASPTNYEISVDFKVIDDKNKARYGVIFGADAGVFGRDAQSKPTYNVNGDYFRFGLQFPDSGAQNVPTFYRLEKCAGDYANCTSVVNKTPLPANLVDGVWDTVTVRRSGTSISVLVNGTTLFSKDDASYTGAREFGVYIQRQDDGGAGQLEIDWDNYRVSQLP
jgi:hypothetical protein